MGEKILIYDIETDTKNKSMKTPEEHKLKFFGAYSFINNKYYFYSEKEKNKIQSLITKHKFLVGYNNIKYDNVVLESEKIYLNFKQIIDLYKVIKNRQGVIKFKKGILSYYLKNLKLDTVTKVLNLVSEETGKKDLDYKMLSRDDFNENELKMIKEYTLRDVEITKKLWDWVKKEFEGWKHHLTLEDQKNYKHLSVSSSVYTYKVICNKAGIDEEYSNDKEYNKFTTGGYVSYPSCEKEEGNIYCLDFASLYPHIMIQCNLYGRNKFDNRGWHEYGVKGYYNDMEESKISKALYEIYLERKELKRKNDPKQYGLKIVMNTIYGILRNSSFKNVYDDIAGNDVCIIGQKWIKLVRKKFREKGYPVIYTDTDSVYIKDIFDNEKALLKIKDDAISEIKKNVPFPKKTFDMDIDYKIDFIHFFKGGNKNNIDENLDDDDLENKKLGFMKKNYIFVSNENGKKELVIKNLGIVKRNNTEVSKKIFWEKISNQIILNHKVKFENEQIKEWIKEYLTKDVSLICKRFSIGNKENYKSKTCLPMQIYNYVPRDKNEPLEDGIYFLVPNKKIGAGKGFKKYCTLEEYAKYLNYDDLYIDVVLKELHYFNENYIPLKNTKKKKIKFEDTLKQLGLW